MKTLNNGQSNLLIRTAINENFAELLSLYNAQTGQLTGLTNQLAVLQGNGSPTTLAVEKPFIFENSKFIGRADYAETNAFAYTVDQTTATSVDVTFCNATNGSVASEVAVYEDLGSGYTLKNILTTGTPGVNTLTQTLSPGFKSVKMVVGGQQRGEDPGLVLGTYLVRKTYNNTAVGVRATRKNSVLFVQGDSISVGINTSHPVTDAIVTKLRHTPDLSEYDIIALGWGYKSYSRAVAQELAAEAAWITSMAAGYQNVKLLTQLGTNDYGLNYGNVTACVSSFTNYVSGLKDTLPNLDICTLLPFRRGYEGNNGLGQSLDDYRNGLESAARSLGLNKIINGKDIDFISNPANRDDAQVHPSTLGVQNVIIPALVSFLTGTSALQQPVISFPQPAGMALGAADQVLNATSTNTVTPIVFTSANPNVATIINGKLHAVGAGTATINAGQQAGNGFGTAATVSRTVTITATANQPTTIPIIASGVTVIQDPANTFQADNGGAYAYSPLHLPAGANGYLQYTLTSAPTQAVLALSTGAVQETSYATFRAAIYTYNNGITFLRDGMPTDQPGGFTAGDVVKMNVSKSNGNANISYQKNNVEMGSFSFPDQDLYLKMWFLEASNRITDIQYGGLVV